ncbi:MAG TPA: hypothetical protein VII73_06730 [Caulobacteraceae bacterium]
MKKPILAAMAALAMLSSQAGAVQAQDAREPQPGTLAYCTEKWDDMVSRHDTGTQDRDDFMRSCVARRHVGGYYDHNDSTLALLGFGGLIGGIILLAFTEGDHHGQPVSP